MNRRVWLLIAQLILAATFILAGALKLRDPQSFAASVATFRVLPKVWSNVVALWLPPLEIFCGTFLFIKPWQRTAAFTAVILNAVFLALLVQGLIRGLDLECGCFGKWDPAANHPSLGIFRDILLLAAATFSYQAFVRRSRQLRSAPKV